MFEMTGLDEPMSLSMEEDQIEKRIELKAARSRVWRALTDYREFSAWFGVKLESPFVMGQTTSGQITYPGYEHLRMKVVVQKIEPERLFSYTWHPYAIEPIVNYSKEQPTLVEFKLEEIAGGTSLTVIESGFSKLPAGRRAEAFRMNDDGWSEQLQNIQRYVAGKTE
jgi:uncharacterized protein YndB with AHSA1/START domain